MKKILYALVLILLFIPSVKAEYKIENYKIDITVLEDGSLDVIEVFNMNPPYNGYERIIYYKDNYNDYLGSIVSSVEDNKIYNGTGVKLKEVRAIDFDLNSELKLYKENGDLFNKENEAFKGDYGVYTTTKLDNGEKYRIYNSSIMNKDIYINYVLEDIAITHADVSEIPFDLSQFQESIKNLEIYIHIPNNKEILDVWVHDIESKVQIIDVNTIKINIKNIEQFNSFDFRIICDKNNYKKQTNEIVYDKIINIEKDLKQNSTDVKNEEYEKLKSLAYDSILKVEKTLKREDYNYSLKTVSSLDEKDDLKTELIVRLMNVESRVLRREMIIKLFYTSILFSWFILLIVICYYIYKRYDKEYKVTFKLKKIDYIPSDIQVSSVGYLFRKKINNNDLKASILKLIYSGNISFNKLSNNDFILKKVSIDNLTESDLRLMKLLFDNKNSVKASKLYGKVSENYNDFLTNYSNWITKATIEAENLEYYEDILLPKILGIVLSVVGFIVSILLVDKSTYFPSYIVLVCSILSFVYFMLLNKRTAKGDIEIAKWKALKNYLYNYNKSDRQNSIDEINNYLLYSLVFNNYDKFSKHISFRYKDLDKKLYKQIDKNLYINDCIIVLIDKLLSKAYSNKNIYFND